MKKELSIAFCGAGAAMLAFGRTPEKDILSCVIWVLALAGIRELTDKRTPKIVYAAPIAAISLDVLAHFFTKEHEFSRLAMGAGALGSALMTMALFITIVAAAPKIGPGLAGACGIGLVLSEGARIYDRQLDLLPNLNRDAAASAHHFFGAIRIVGSAGAALVPVAWIALCAAPFTIEVVRSRRLLIAGAIGFGACSALFYDLPDRAEIRNVAVLPAAFYFIGWILCILGAAAIARSTRSGRAWAGFAVCIVQVPAFILLVAGLDASDVRIPIVMSIAFGALGLALATSTHRLLRWAAIPFAVAAVGALLVSAGLFLSLQDIVRIHDNPADWWPAKIARETFVLGLDLALAIALFVTAPPKAAGPGQTLPS